MSELQVETRPCGQCVHFQAIGRGGLKHYIPICTKKLMSCVATLKVSFKAEEGTCFTLATPKEIARQAAHEIMMLKGTPEGTASHMVPIILWAAQRIKDLPPPPLPDNRHVYEPNKKYPWFCAHCGYAAHELIMHLPTS